MMDTITQYHIWSIEPVDPMTAALEKIKAGGFALKKAAAVSVVPLLLL